MLIKALNVSDSVSKLVANFMAIYEGPYLLSKKFGQSTFLLVNPDTMVERGKFHASFFRPYYRNGQTKEETKRHNKNNPAQAKRSAKQLDQDQNNFSGVRRSARILSKTRKTTPGKRK